jgi:selenide,water dikinase
VLSALPLPVDPNVLVGFGTNDDAAIYRLTPDLALALTIDVFTPVVDDPYAFGAIAAANALSDVYAMGAKPAAMLSFVGFPRGKLPWDVLQLILQGGADKGREAGVDVVGGHTVDDPEPKCGYAVMGLVHPEKAISNAGGRPGDLLVLTKPLGSGILTTAIKRDLLGPDAISQVVAVMSELNRGASDAMVGVGVDACTDVTGFGLLGHLHELARASGVAADLDARSIPMLPGVLDLIHEGVVPGGTATNAEYTEQFVAWSPAISAETRLALADAQTSGGLLIAVAPSNLGALTEALHSAEALAAVVGRLTDGTPGYIAVSEELRVAR